MHTFKLKILTPNEKLFDGEVVSFTVPTQSGEITVLKNHAPLITLISIGEIRTKGVGAEQKFLVQGGVIDVKQSAPDPRGSQYFEVVILADQVVDTNLDSFDAEIERAKKAMELRQEDLDFELEESIIEKNLFIKRMKGK